jgi:16S rRNA (cytosine967-C5)-methyltransferase
MTADAVEQLATLQREILTAAAELVRPGGTVVYSVCTLTNAETHAIDEWLEETKPDLVPEPPLKDPWQPLGRGARLLPQAADTDGMYILGLQRKGQ